MPDRGVAWAFGRKERKKERKRAEKKYLTAQWLFFFVFETLKAHLTNFSTSLELRARGTVGGCWAVE
jgi:hypothetical protein